MSAKKIDVEELISQLSHPDPGVRKHAAMKLAWSEDKRVIAPLIAALEDESMGVRFAAALGLKQTETNEALYPLIYHLKHDESGKVRAVCGMSLSNIGGDEALDALTQALEDPDRHVKTMVCSVLAPLEDRRALASIRQLIDDPDWDVRLDACKTLVQWKQVDQRVLEEIQELRKSPRAEEYEQGFAGVVELMNVIAEAPELIGQAAECMGRPMSEEEEIRARDAMETVFEDFDVSELQNVPDWSLAGLEEQARRLLKDN